MSLKEEIVSFSIPTHTYKTIQLSCKLSCRTLTPVFACQQLIIFKHNYIHSRIANIEHRSSGHMSNNNDYKYHIVLYSRYIVI